MVSETGHTDLLVVADAGLPVPLGVERVDLAVRPGLPGFLEVLDVLLAELSVEGATVAREMTERNPEVLAALQERLTALGVTVEHVAHTELKALSTSARAVVRTGECTPFANVVLHAGVAF